MVLNSNLPFRIKAAWLLRMLEQIQADDLSCLIKFLCEHYDSLQDVPASGEIADGLERLLGKEAVDCLRIPESLEVSRHPGDMIEATLSMLDTWAIVFSRDRSELIRGYFRGRSLDLLAVSSDEVKRRTLAAAPHNRSELAVGPPVQADLCVRRGCGT